MLNLRSLLELIFLLLTLYIFFKFFLEMLWLYLAKLLLIRNIFFVVLGVLFDFRFILQFLLIAVVLT